MRLGLVTIVLDPPHGPVSDCFALEMETDGQQGKERHDPCIHSVGFHISKLGGGRHATEESRGEKFSFDRLSQATCIVGCSRVGQAETNDAPCRADHFQDGSTPGRVTIEQSRSGRRHWRRLEVKIQAHVSRRQVRCETTQSLTESKVGPAILKDNDKSVELLRVSISSTEKDGGEHAQCDRERKRYQIRLG